MISLKGPEAVTQYRRFRDRFAQAIDGRFYGIEYLDYLVLGCGVATLHVGDEAALITDTRHYPNCKAAHVLIAAGDMAEIVEVLRPQVEAWAKDRGCKFAVVESRPGWERALKDCGYSPFQYSVSKEL